MMNSQLNTCKKRSTKLTSLLVFITMIWMISSRPTGLRTSMNRCQKAYWIAYKQNAWLYTMDRFWKDGLAEDENNIKNWDQNNFDKFDLDLCSYGISREDLLNSIMKGNSKSSASSCPSSGISTNVKPSPLMTKQQLENWTWGNGKRNHSSLKNWKEDVMFYTFYQSLKRYLKQAGCERLLDLK